MHYLSLILTLCTMAPTALSAALVPRAPSVTKITTVSITTTTTTRMVPVNLEWTVTTAGPLNIIPGVLTITFTEVPAYFYLETSVPDVVVSTITKKVVLTSTITPTSTSGPQSSSSSSSSAIPTKSLSSCNVSGQPSTALTSHTFSTGSEGTVLECQTSCFFTSACQVYSYNKSTGNCGLYSTGAASDMATLVTKEKTKTKDEGTVVSKKYPNDGSNFCYGSTGY